MDNIYNYRNDEMIMRFSSKYSLTIEESELVFKETLVFLNHIEDFQNSNIIVSGFTPIPIIIDEMWHNMILFTKEYNNICQKYFKSYIHHLPASRLNKIEFQNEISNEHWQSKLRDIYSKIYDIIGKDSFHVWYEIFDKKYKKIKLTYE